MVYLAELSVCVNSVQNYCQNLCSKCAPRTQTKALRRRRYWLIAASTIDWSVVKLRSLIDQTRFEFIDVSYFGAVNCLPQNTTDAVFCNINHILVYCMLLNMSL